MRRASEFAIYALAVLIPTVVVPHYLLHPFDLPKVLVLLAGVGLLVILNPEPLKRIPVPVLLLLCLNAISLVYTKNLEYTLHFGALNVATLLLIVYTAEYINTPKKAKRLFAFICLGGVVAAVFALLQYQGVHLFTAPGLAVPVGTVGNGNFFGTYLLFPIIALAGLFFLEDNKRVRSGLFIVGLLLFVAFLLARCRSSWLAFGIIAIPFIWFVPTKKDWAVGLAFVMMITLVVAATLFPKSHLNWTETNTLKERVKYWQAATYLIKKNPVYGHGIESYRNLVYEAQAKIGEQDPEYWPDYEVPKPRHPHNQYLEILVDGGIVAAGILVWFLLYYLRPAWIFLRECTGDKRLIMGTAFFAIMAMLVSMFFYFPLKEVTTLCMIGLMMGVMGGMVHVPQSKKMNNPMLVQLALAVFVVIVVSHVAIRPALSNYYAQKAMRVSLDKDMDLATANILKAIAYSPNSSEHWQYLGMIMLIQKRDPLAAKDFFERALLPFNGNIVQWSPHYWIGVSNLMLRRPDEAIPGLEMALHYWPAHPDAKTLIAKVRQLAKKDKK